MDITQADISFHSNEIKRELESLKEILKKTAEIPAVVSTNNLIKVKNSQITNTSNYLTKFLNSCHEYPEVFSIFAKKSIDHDIFIKIPETLLYSSHGKNPIFLYNSLEGYICADSSDSSITSFFSTVEKLASTDLQDPPFFIHKSKGGGSNLYSDSLKARKEFEECPYRFHMLQRYIRVGSNSAWCVCVDWTENNIKYFTLVNNVGFGNNRADVEVKDRFGNLKFDKQKLLVHCRDYKSYHIVASLQPIATLNRIAKETLPVINKLVYNSQRVSEIIVSYLKGSKNEWVFIGVLGCKLKGKEIKIVTSKSNIIPLRPNISRKPLISFTKEEAITSPDIKEDNTLARVENRRISKISRKIYRKATTVESKPSNPPKANILTKEEEYSLYLKQKSSDSLGRIPFNMIGIVPHKVGNRLAYYIEEKKELIPNPVALTTPLGFFMGNELSVKSNIEYLQRVTGELDRAVARTAELKKRAREKAPKSNEILLD